MAVAMVDCRDLVRDPVLFVMLVRLVKWSWVFVYFHSIEYHLENQKLPVWERCAHYKEYPSSEIVKLLLGNESTSQ